MLYLLRVEGKPVYKELSTTSSKARPAHVSRAGKTRVPQNLGFRGLGCRFRIYT